MALVMLRVCADIESGNKRCDHQGAIPVSIHHKLAKKERGLAMRGHKYPMANVLQSAAGAKDVTAIWSSVLTDRCSEVCGSKVMISPLEFPRQKSVSNVVLGSRLRELCKLTKSNVPIFHPGRRGEMVIGGESGNFVSVNRSQTIAVCPAS